MATAQDRYFGREQSYIKHLFLTQYLQAAAFKTFQGRSSTFNFVDAFAGPWRVSDEENLSDASFDQALRTLETVRATLSRKGTASLKIRFCLCEREAHAATKLRRYAKRNRKFEIHVFHGSFEDHLDAITAACRDGFTFTFIDPTGWNIRSEPVLQFLREQKGEFLLNFMAEHVNRHAEYSKVAASFGRFLAEPDWESDFNALSADWTNEMRVMHLLKAKMKATGAATYLADFPILKPREERVKMRLVLGTHTPKGLEVFRNVQAKVELMEIEMRSNLRNLGSRQVRLFSDEQIGAMQQNAAGIGCHRFQREAEARVKELLTRQRFTPFSVIATDVLEAIPMRLTQVKSLAKAMKKRGIITFDLPPRKSVPQPETRVSLIAHII